MREYEFINTISGSVHIFLANNKELAVKKYEVWFGFCDDNIIVRLR